MVDSFIPATPGVGIQVETAALTRADGTVVQRERVTIGDNNNIGQFLDIDLMLQSRRYGEAQTMWMRDQTAIMTTVTRFCARVPMSDTRGRFDRGYR